MDKKKALEASLAGIEKAYGKGAVMRLGQNTAMTVESIPTGAISLDIALGIGGVPRGRIIEIYGPVFCIEYLRISCHSYYRLLTAWNFANLKPTLSHRQYYSFRSRWDLLLRLYLC
jgi:hypothetical protein